MRSSILLLPAIGLVSLAAAAEPPPGSAPAPASQALPAPPPIAQPAPVSRAPGALPATTTIDLTHVGVAAIVLATFSGGVAGACASGYTGSGLRTCHWAAGGMAIGLAVTSIPFFILGAKQPATLARITDRLTLTATGSGAKLGWTATF